jgi:hypothetical protein
MRNHKSPRDRSAELAQVDLDESKITRDEILAHLNLTGQDLSSGLTK